MEKKMTDNSYQKHFERTCACSSSITRATTNIRFQGQRTCSDIFQKSWRLASPVFLNNSEIAKSVAGLESKTAFLACS